MGADHRPMFGAHAGKYRRQCAVVIVATDEGGHLVDARTISDVDPGQQGRTDGYPMLCQDLSHGLGWQAACWAHTLRHALVRAS